MKMEKVGKLLYVRNVARMLNCSDEHVYRLIRDGKVDAVRLGIRGIRVFEASVIRFLEQARIDNDDFYL